MFTRTTDLSSSLLTALNQSDLVASARTVTKANAVNDNGSGATPRASPLVIGHCRAKTAKAEKVNSVKLLRATFSRLARSFSYSRSGVLLSSAYCSLPTCLLASAIKMPVRPRAADIQPNEGLLNSNIEPSSPIANTNPAAASADREIIFQPKLALNLANTNETAATITRSRVQNQAGAVSQVNDGEEISPVTRIANINMADENVAMKLANITENFLPQKANAPVISATTEVTPRKPSSGKVFRLVETKMLPAITMIALAPIINHC